MWPTTQLPLLMNKVVAVQVSALVNVDCMFIQQVEDPSYYFLPKLQEDLQMNYNNVNELALASFKNESPRKLLLLLVASVACCCCYFCTVSLHMIFCHSCCCTGVRVFWLQFKLPVISTSEPSPPPPWGWWPACQLFTHVCYREKRWFEISLL